MFTAPADQHPAWGVLPFTTMFEPFIAHLLGVHHPEAAPGCCFTLSFSEHLMSNHSETLSTAELSPCHIQWMNKGAGRMNVTVSAITESALLALALGNLQCLLLQLLSKRHGWDKRRCRLSLVPCISASLYQNQREQSQGPTSHFTVLLSYPNIIHCKSCFSWQDKQFITFILLHMYHGEKKQRTQHITTHPEQVLSVLNISLRHPHTYLSPQFQG